MSRGNGYADKGRGNGCVEEDRGKWMRRGRGNQCVEKTEVMGVCRRRKRQWSLSLVSEADTGKAQRVGRGMCVYLD